MQISKISLVLSAFIACAPLTLRATDTPAQAAARAQLEAKLKELDGAASTTSHTMADPQPLTHAEPAMKPIRKPKASPSEEASAKAQAKADKAAADLKVRQDVERAAADLKAQKQTAKAAPKAGKLISQAEAGKDIGLQPIAAPALPISASKESRLQALLAKYQADQLSPEEYHKQRAAILAAP